MQMTSLSWTSDPGEVLTLAGCTCGVLVFIVLFSSPFLPLIIRPKGFIKHLLEELLNIEIQKYENKDKFVFYINSLSSRSLWLS